MWQGSEYPYEYDKVGQEAYEGLTLLTFESSPSKIQADYCLVRSNQRKFLQDIEVLRIEDFITQRKEKICSKQKDMETTRSQ